MKLNEFSKVAAIGAMAAGLNGCGDDGMDVTYRCGDQLNGTRDVPLNDFESVREHCWDYVHGEIKMAQVECQPVTCQNTCNPGPCGTCQPVKPEPVSCQKVFNMSSDTFNNAYSSCVGNSSDTCTEYLTNK